MASENDTRSGFGKPVWVDRATVGRGQHWQPRAEMTGPMTAKPLRPRVERL